MATQEEMTPLDTLPQSAVDEMRIEQTVEEVRQAAYWFFGVAALSVINSFLVSKGTYFILGLAISQVVDLILVDITGTQNLLYSVVPALIFMVFGIFAAKRHAWAFIVGGLVYALDGVLYLFFHEWLAAGVHVFILYKIFKGFRSLNEYQELVSKRA